MSPQAQIIAIAEACGWINQGRAKAVLGLVGRWRHPQIKNHFVTTDLLPDYLNDLNAMHEAEASLSPNEMDEMNQQLLSVVERDFRPKTPTSTINIWHATAAQRAEAFLRTLGRWDDSK